MYLIVIEYLIVALYSSVSSDSKNLIFTIKITTMRYRSSNYMLHKMELRDGLFCRKCETEKETIICERRKNETPELRNI